MPRAEIKQIVLHNTNRCNNRHSLDVMAGLVPAIHVFAKTYYLRRGFI